jgi:glycosyltransferase involved in cell wall biosynthesis
VSDARPRIGLLTEHADFYGGGQRSLRDLAEALRSTAFEPVVLLPPGGPLAAALADLGIETEPLGLPALGRLGGLAAARAAARLARLARLHRLALLHSDSPRGALYAGLAAAVLHLPHVWHVRASRPARFLPDRLLLALSRAAVAVSRAAARRSRPLRVSGKVRVIPTGLPDRERLDRRAARAALGLPGEAFVAGVVGRIERDKGVEDAVEALPSLREVAPGALLVFVGADDARQPLGGSLQRRAAALGCGGSVRLPGERPEAASLLPAFDLLLHPSRHEALPRAVLEALHAGVPVVAAAVGGVPEIIDSGSTGLLVPAGDARALGRAAATLAADPALRSRMAESGRESARARFGIAAMVRAITALYADLLHPTGSTMPAPEGEAVR